MIGLTGVGGICAQEADMVIVKYGKLSVKSPLPDAKVYVDDVYKGPAGSLIDTITVGGHIISCRTETQAVSGSFTIRKDEVLLLEANFDAKKLVAQAEREKTEKATVEKKREAPKFDKPKTKPEKPEKPKKPVVEVIKEERRSPQEERRAQHLNVIKVFFEDIEMQEVHINHKINPRVTSKYAEKRNQTGTYFRTKQNVLLCDAGPCEQLWETSFVYADETGKSDTFGLTWKQTVFNGITPAGTSKRELRYCLNGECRGLEDASVEDNPLVAAAGRYLLKWTKSSLIIRRADIAKEINDAGGSVDVY